MTIDAVRRRDTPIISIETQENMTFASAMLLTVCQITLQSMHKMAAEK
jgi:hypothetical protein